MSKLDDLLGQVKKELEVSRAQITANSQQLEALHSSHEDTKKQLDEAQKSLIATRSEQAKVKVESDRLVQEAQQQAAQIRGAADSAATQTIVAATARAKIIIEEAEKAAIQITADLKEKKSRLTGEVANLRNEHSSISARISELKSLARHIVGG